jgi:hypothetical protein
MFSLLPLKLQNRLYNYLYVSYILEYNSNYNNIYGITAKQANEALAMILNKEKIEKQNPEIIINKYHLNFGGHNIAKYNFLKANGLSYRDDKKAIRLVYSGNYIEPKLDIIKQP